MDLKVTEADLDTNEEAIVSALKQFLTPRSDARRFQWLYRDNPFGRARTWVTSKDGQIIGVASAFPRRIYAGTQEIGGWVLGDFCVANGFRTLGPALQLQRCLWQEVESGSVPFFYDFPSAAMMAVFRRLHINQTEQCVRHVKLLRLDRKVKAIVKSPILAKMICVLGNGIFQLATRRSVSAPYRILPHSGNCGEEFSSLAHEIRGRYGLCVQRTAQYLNWRYLANPLESHEVITARRDGLLKGYVVVRQADEGVSIVDGLASDEEGLLDSLIGRCVELLRERGVGAVHVPMLSRHPWRATLGRHGFRSRESVPFIAAVSSTYRSHLAQDAVWAIMDGDRDS